MPGGARFRLRTPGRSASLGRMTRDPEMKDFSNGGRLAVLGFCVNNRKKNPKTEEWEDEPCWLTLKAFNRQNGRKLADLCEQYLHKGDQVYFEGHLVLEEWEVDDGKRQKLVIVVDDIQFLQPKKDGDNGKPRASQAPAARQPAAPDDDLDIPADDETIPF